MRATSGRPARRDRPCRSSRCRGGRASKSTRSPGSNEAAGRSGHGLDDGARAEAARADPQPAPCSTDQHADLLDVRVPDARADIVRVTDLVSVHRSLAAHVARPRHVALLRLPEGRPRLTVALAEEAAL